METISKSRSDEETIAQVLNWSNQQRAKLTYRLLLSLEDRDHDATGLSREEIDQLWEDEAQRRLTVFDAGKIGSLGREEAMRLARAGLTE